MLTDIGGLRGEQDGPFSAGAINSSEVEQKLRRNLLEILNLGDHNMLAHVHIHTHTYCIAPLALSSPIPRLGRVGRGRAEGEDKYRGGGRT